MYYRFLSTVVHHKTLKKQILKLTGFLNVCNLNTDWTRMITIRLYNLITCNTGTVKKVFNFPVCVIWFIIEMKGPFCVIVIGLFFETTNGKLIVQDESHIVKVIFLLLWQIFYQLTCFVFLKIQHAFWFYFLSTLVQVLSCVSNAFIWPQTFGLMMESRKNV